MATQDTDAELQGGSHESTVVGDLEPNVAGALCYLFGFLSGVLFLVAEEDNEFVRFHAAQSIAVFAGITALSMGLWVVEAMLDVIPFIGFIFGFFFSFVWLVLQPAMFVLWLFLMYKAYEGERNQLPVVGDFAEDLV